MSHASFVLCLFCFLYLLHLYSFHSPPQLLSPSQLIIPSRISQCTFQAVHHFILTVRPQRRRGQPIKSGRASRPISRQPGSHSRVAVSDSDSALCMKLKSYMFRSCSVGEAHCGQEVQCCGMHVACMWRTACMVITPHGLSCPVVPPRSLCVHWHSPLFFPLSPLSVPPPTTS